MNIKLILSTSLIAVCGIASAQTVTEITDPAKIAEIERHAQQLQSAPAPAMGDHMDGMHHKAKMHKMHKMHAKKMKATADAAAPAAADTPMAEPAKK
jgi:hypothetical protein